YQLGMAASVLALGLVGASSLIYWRQQREARAARAALAMKAVTLLRYHADGAPHDVSRWEAVAKGVEAVAQALAEGGDGAAGARLRREIQSRRSAARDDRALQDALTNARSDLITHGLESESGLSHADGAYAAAFRGVGLDIEKASPAEYAAALKA